MQCGWCGRPLEQRGPRERQYCNASCRGKAWQRRRKQVLREEALEEAVRMIRGAMRPKSLAPEAALGEAEDSA